MQIKVFTETGHDGIIKLESVINRWLGEQPPEFILKHTNTAMCTIGDGGNAEQYQSIVITIWHDRSSN